MSQNRLIRMEPARGAFVSTPSIAEAQQVFAVRRMLEAGMTQAFMRQADGEQIAALKDHIAQEKQAVLRGMWAGAPSCWATFTCAWPS
jgi:DNA-binding GntR family transcriptional regulator